LVSLQSRPQRRQHPSSSVMSTAPVGRASQLVQGDFFTARLPSMNTRRGGRTTSSSCPSRRSP
jgi:hypothetical protein